MSDTTLPRTAPRPFFNKRRRTLLVVGLGTFILLGIFFWGIALSPESYGPNYSARRLAPCWAHLFGTDNLGRDMFYRTIAGMSLSIRIGLLSAGISSLIALVLGTLSAVFGGWVDTVVNYLVDLCMGVPHLILLILISIAMGGGAAGVITGVAVTHWPSLTRLLRAEVMQLRASPYVQLSRRFGHGPVYIALKHILPHIFPQFCRRTGAAVPAPDPARGQHHLPRLRPAARHAGDGRDPGGVDEVPGDRHVVAGVLPRSGPADGLTALRRGRRIPQDADRPVQLARLGGGSDER